MRALAYRNQHYNRADITKCLRVGLQLSHVTEETELSASVLQFNHELRVGRGAAGRDLHASPG